MCNCRQMLLAVLWICDGFQSDPSRKSECSQLLGNVNGFQRLFLTSFHKFIQS